MQDGVGKGRGGVSVVVPVYNSAGTVAELLERLEAVLKGTGGPFEVVLVNDGSRDESWAAVQMEATTREWVVGIDLMRNYGQHNSLLCGIRAATYEVIVTMDDDLQNPPEEIPKLLAKLDAGYDVVYGTPDVEQHGVLRDLASQLTKLALKATMGAEIATKVSAFRAFRREVRGAFASYDSPFVSIDVLLTWGAKRFSAVTVRHEARAEGMSNYTFRKLAGHAVNMMTGFSIVPLRFASLTGFSFALFGVLILIFVVGRFLIQGQVVPGFAFLASIISIFAGAQLLALGIIGEYLARMHFRSMGKPAFVEKARVTSTRLPSE